MPGPKDVPAAASTISPLEFQAALDRYPALLSEVSQSKGARPGQKPLEQLDRYRFEQATALFAVESDSPQVISIDEVKTLVEWKLRHGKFRPMLMSLVSQNQPPVVKQAIQDGIKAYREEENSSSNSKERIKAALGHISQLKGIGPATASLLVAVHFPRAVIFFSDEAFWWLCCGGRKDQIKYSVNEYLALAEAADALRDRLRVPATDVEKVAYVLMREETGVAAAAAAAAAESIVPGKKTKADKEAKTKKAQTTATRTKKPQPPKRKLELQEDTTQTGKGGVGVRRSKRNKA